jgi:hypothetical protein
MNTGSVLWLSDQFIREVVLGCWRDRALARSGGALDRLSSINIFLIPTVKLVWQGSGGAPDHYCSSSPVRMTPCNSSLTRPGDAPDHYYRRSGATTCCAVFIASLQRLQEVVGTINTPNKNSRYTRAIPNIHTLIATTPKHPKPPK